MNGLDVVLILFALFAFVGGYRKGLLVRVVIWVATLLGLFLAASNIGAILKLMGKPAVKNRFAAILLALVGGLVVGRLVGQLLGSWFKSRIPTRPLRSLDRYAGGIVGIGGVLLTGWLALPLLTQVPGWPATSTRGSLAAKLMHEKLPEPPNTIGSLRHLLADGQFPQVLSSLDRAMDTGQTPSLVNFDPTVTDAVGLSTMRISAEGCGDGTEGSGFIIGGGRLLTAAHLVTGAKAITAIRDDGTTLNAQLAAVDPIRDLAVLSVEGLVGDPVTFAPPEAGTKVAVMGYRNSGALQMIPGGVRDLLTLNGRDIFDKAKIARPVVVLASKLAAGDAGAAVINETGQVVAAAFAAAPDRSSTGYAISSDEITKFLADVDNGVRGTVPGRCIAR